MKKITVENEQIIIKILINALERESDKETRALLNTIKKQAYNRQYRLSKKLNDISLTGIERYILEKQYNQAVMEYMQVSEDVARVRQSLSKNIKVTSAINRLNINVAKIAARKSNLQNLQKKAKTVIGVSELNVAVNRKKSALIEQYVYNAKGANIPQEMFSYIDNVLNSVIGFNFSQAVDDGFTRLQSFSSDDLFEVLLDVAQSAENVMQERSTDLSAEEKEQLNNVIYMLNSRNLL